MATYPGRVDLDPRTLSEIIDSLPEQALLIVVEGAGERMGLVALCPSFVAAIIEQQSLGRVSGSPPRPRRPTRTDAAICADFVNATLAELGAELSAFGGPPAGAFRYASFVEDPKPLELILEDCSYCAIRVEMQVGKGGQRAAHLMVMLPDEGGHGFGTGARALAAPADETPPASLGPAIQAAPLALSAVLSRQQLTLGQLRALAAGGELPLPRHVLEAVRVEGADGTLLMLGRLGELNGAPALRLRGLSRGDAVGEAGTAFAPASQDAEPVAQEPPMGDLSAPDPFRETVEAPPLQMVNE